MFNMADKQPDDLGLLQPDPDQEALEEKVLFKLIATRRGKLGVLTRKRNEIDSHMQSGQPKESVKPLVTAFQGYLEEFVSLQPSVQQSLKDEHEREADRLDWYEPKCQSLERYLESVTEWVNDDQNEDDEKSEHVEEERPGKEKEMQDTEDDIHPQDSACQTAPSVTHSRRTRSALSGASQASYVKAKAECVAIRAKAQALQTKYLLDLEEAKLKA